MEKRILLYTFLFLLLSTIGVSCNEDEEETDSSVATYTQSSTAITEFNLIENSNILANLDSVFFTIDLVQARIYNADSLPKGTDVSRMLVQMSYPNCYSVEVSISNATRMNDTTFAYSNSDTIDFTGEVKIKVTALDQVTNRTYDVRVNVHQLESDSLQWGDVAYSTLPSVYGNVTSQKSVEWNDDVYCLMADDGYFVLASADDPTSPWSQQIVEFPFTPDVRSFSASDDALYILSAENGELYTSTDGTTWTSCGTSWNSILGAYGNRILGIRNDGGTYSHDEYPRPAGFAPVVADSDFPVKGMSGLVGYKSSWGTNLVVIGMGGVTAGNEVSGRAWAYDGNSWSVLSNSDIEGHEGMSLISYTTYKVNENNWTATAYPTLMALGGRKADGELSKTLYVSRDMGIHWSVADSLMQLPEYIPAMANTDALVFNSTMTDVATAQPSALMWRCMPAMRMPVWYNMAMPAAFATKSSGITSPITEWDVPYIYLFGGEGSDGSTFDTVWRGVLNRLSYKPVY